MIGEKTSGAGAMTQDVGVRFPTKQVFGLRVHGVNEAQFQELVWRCASNGQGFAATYATAHSLTMSRGDAVFRDTVNAFDVCYPDGRGVGLVTVLLGQGLMPKTTANRFFLPLCRRAAEAGLGIALIGGRPGIAEKVAEVIRALNPSARVSTCDGFCSTQRMTALNGFDANIVFLAM
ncbi:MAG: WecB/TagA/CpsF family glycosyltransferase, partial [Limisphaerales bacterium]